MSRLENIVFFYPLTFPAMVSGTLSPYPTVVIVTTVYLIIESYTHSVGKELLWDTKEIEIKIKKVVT